MAIQIRSHNEILGDIIRKIIADTPLNDINTGSVLLTLLEAIASSDYENNAAILSVLELLNIDALRNNDLDARAADFGLERRPAVRASGFVKISDSTISKRSTSLYPVKPPPIAGSTQIFVNDASDWSSSGDLYIGRGTTNFEGPISYSNITDNGTFFTIDLVTALQKDHLISDIVVDGQGTTDRLIPAGTIVKIPANNQNPEIQYNTIRDAVIPAGEETVTEVDTLALTPGSLGNAGIGTITTFAAIPFTGAVVTNTTPFSGGRDVESDDDLRNRIKSFAQTLARGTRTAIIEAIKGLSNAEENKQVASAVIQEPVSPGEPSILFIDDGGVFQPSQAGQSVDILLNDASGDEEFLQLANFPIPRPQVINTAQGPYQLVDGMELRVRVDSDEETIVFSRSDFVNISAATLPEIVTAINDRSTIFKARLTRQSTRLLIYANRFDAEIIQVVPVSSISSTDLIANNILKFPTEESSHIFLYQNSTLLREKERSAQLTTTLFATWNITTDSNIVISVDGTPAQDRNFTSSDFGGQSFASLNLDDWVAAFNRKFAGLQAEELSDGTMRITSNRSGNESSLEILGGTLLTKLFANLPTESTGQTAEFELNRQNGNVRILTDVVSGDRISAGTSDAKGALTSLPTTTGTYNVSADSNGRPAKLVIVADASRVTPRSINLPIGASITISDEGSNVMRITSSVLSAFRDVVPTTNDYLYITKRSLDPGWVNEANTGLFKVIAKGDHTTAGVDSYIEVSHFNIVPGTHTVNDSDDIQAFFSDAYPQVWDGSLLDNPPAATIQEVVESINNQTSNVIASIFKTNRVKVTSSTEEGGSIAIPVATGNATLLFEGFSTAQFGNISHIANRRPAVESVTYFRRTQPTNDNVFLGRYTYTDLRGPITANDTPGTEGVDSFSDVIESAGVLVDSLINHDDIINFTKGNNKNHFKAVKQILSGDRIGTQFGVPNTVLKHIEDDDEIQVMKSLQLADSDNIVFILDQDPVNKTIDVQASRTGKVNSGSQASSFLPQTLAFSADDADNETGVDFGTPQVWSKVLNNTEFRDYKMWFRARNWYVTGGVGSGAGGSMLIRSIKYGPAGEKTRFAMDYPAFPDLPATTTATNNPFYTMVRCVFGSGAARTTNILSGTVIDITDLGNSIFRYEFSVGVDLSTVQVGDVFSALDDSGISVANRGQFRVLAVDSPNRRIEVYNPDGAPTNAGAPEITDITTIADVVGSPAAHEVTTVADVSGSLDGKYFILQDTNGSVAFWFDIDNSGTVEPTHGATRSVEVFNVNTGDSADTVASKVATVINTDPEFSATVISNVITVTNAGNGSVPAGGAGTSGFTVTQTATGVDDDSLDGTYFILQGQSGSVAFWFDVDATGTLEPIHPADRSVQIATVTSGDSASTVAGRVQMAVNADADFTATVSGSTVTVTDVANEARPAPSAGTSGFSLSTVQNGSDGVPETVIAGSSVNMYPLTGTTVSDIVSEINETEFLRAVAIGDDSLTIVKATREEVYTPAGPDDFSASLSHGHDPDPTSGLNDFIPLRDSETWVLRFNNTNPNFTLKKPLVLVDVAPSVYSMDTAPNEDSAELGEFFKLIPTTIENVLHHFTQKALSQLPIVADVRVADESKAVQIKSKFLGSSGSVEVVGGQANKAPFNLIGDSQVITESGQDFLAVKVRAFPDTINPRDTIKLENVAGVQRLQRLNATDSLDVVKIADEIFEYRYNTKSTFFSQFVKFTITDVSALYARPAGTIWRWQHSDSGSFADITDKTVGVPSAQPDDEAAGGGVDAPALEVLIDDPGTSTTALDFRLTVGNFPTQSDYFTFQSASGATFAAWFDIDNNGTLPTGATFVAATNKIEVDIATGDTDNQVVSKLVTTLQANINFSNEFTLSQTQGATLDDVSAGDIVSAHGTLPGWSPGNKVRGTGNNRVSGLPIIAVNSVSRYFDIVNSEGEGMTSTAVGGGGSSAIDITAAAMIEWRPSHTSRIPLNQVVVVSGTATATTSIAHNLKPGDTFDILNNGATPTTPGSGVGTVVTVSDFNQFAYATSAADNTYFGGSVLDTSKTVTRYKVETLGFKNLVRLSHVDGDSPRFVDNGAAVDDLLLISGDTFNSNNNGSFRIRAVDNTSMILENDNAQEEVNTDAVPFNNTNTTVAWVANSNQITGSAGSFENLTVGDAVKKVEDDETLFVQILAFNTGNPSTATTVTLNAQYRGTSADSLGVSFDQKDDVNTGVFLESTEDLRILEGDSVRANDELFISTLANPNWFSIANSGTFTITEVGTAADQRPFLRVSNVLGLAEQDRLMSVDEDGLTITEADDNRFSSVREVAHIDIDELNSKRRVAYLTPADRSYKFSESNKTVLSAMGKLNYSTDVTIGRDGYLYYTGLLRDVQRTMDGFEPDPDTFPGRRAVGGVIEILPPLIRRVAIVIDVTTDEGINLGEISNEIKSVIISYVNELGVGEDVILSEITARVMQIRGVAAMTFNEPTPDTERIPVADIEKAFLDARDISIA